MAIPDREEARRILSGRRLPPEIVVHSEGVARVAAAAARLVADAGIPVDLGLVEAAALLHDIDKVEHPDGAEHGTAGARMLEKMGFGDLALPVASHPVTALLDDERYPRGWPSVLVCVADKHVTESFVTIDERLDDMARRYPEYRNSIEAARRPAHALERELAEATGLSEQELIERLRAAWAEEAP